MASESTQQQQSAGASTKTVSSVSGDFVKAIKETLGETKLTNKDIKAVAESFIQVLVSQLKEGKSVSFTNHFTFKRALRGDRTHKNPKTGEEVFKKAHYVLSVDVKPSLKKVIESLPVAEGAKPEVAETTSDE